MKQKFKTLFIEDVLSTRNLQKGIDFEVVSYMVLDHDFDFHSADYFLGLNSFELLKRKNYNSNLLRDYFREQGRMQDVIDLSLTPYPCAKDRTYDISFYKMEGDINFDYAISTGFGVVKMMKGKYKGEYLLYNSTGYIEDNDEIEMALIEEMLMLQIYVQLTNSTEHYDQKLEGYLKTDMDYLATLLPGDPSRILNKLQSIFNSKNGKVIPFVRKKKY